MPGLKDVIHRKSFSLHALRVRLSDADALPQLTLLGLLTGIIAGFLLIAFRELLTYFSSLFMIAGEDNFEALPIWFRFLLPIAGSIVILVMILACRPKRRTVGVSHVIQRLAFHRGKLPVSSTILQFFTAITALVTGFSVGREGPAVHVGAGAGSILGQRLRLPDNTLKTLAGCGVATAISVLFNTPLAGVVFALEVIVRQYTLTSFIPIMAASVVSSLMTQWVYGKDVAFHIPMIEMTSLSEFGVAFILAAAIGLLAALFIHLQTSLMVARRGRLVAPVLMAGVLMGGIGIVFPELMGMGYDTTTSILNGSHFTLSFLALLVFGKLIATALVTGLGIPGGIMGPTLFIGAATGAAFGILGESLLDVPNINSSFHALLGMVAMMAATLQAPLVALVTVLELTRNPNVIMPAMFVIVIACLVSGRFFKQRGIFDLQLLKGGYSFGESPLKEQLGSVGVASLMTKDFVVADSLTALPASAEASWLLREESGKVFLTKNTMDDTSIKHFFHKEKSVVPVISMQATLFEALETMNKEDLDALPVITKRGFKAKGRFKVSGVITRENIEALYLNGVVT